MKNPLLEAALKFRAELVAGEDAATRAMLDVYAKAYGRFEPKLVALLAEIGREGLTPERLFEKRRLETIVAQLGEELQGFARNASRSVAASQQEAMQLAQRHARSLTLTATGAPPAGFSGSTWQTVPHAALEDLVGLTADGAPVALEIAKLVPQAVRKVRDALVNGVAAGLTPDAIARSVKADLGQNAGRFLTVARTADIQAYTLSQMRAFEENRDVVKGWRWVAALSFDTCAACLALHGREFPLGAPFERHFNCRCMAVPITFAWRELGFEGIDEKRAPWQTGEEWLRGQSAANQSRTLTPSKLEQWQTGAIHLQDLETRQEVPHWGAMVREGTLREAMDAARVRATGVASPNAAQTGAPGGNLPPRPPSGAPPLVSSSGSGGLAVKEAFDVTFLPVALRPEVDAALDAASQVHRFTGNLVAAPPLSIVEASGKRLQELIANQADALYDKDDVTGEPINIAINPSGNLGLLRHVTLHEIGHYIDHQAIGAAGIYSSSGSPLLAEVTDALDASARIQEIRALYANPTLQVAHGGRQIALKLPPEVVKHLEYLARDREIFARAYAQWITIRSGDAALLSQLKSLQPQATHNELEAALTMQWDDADFAPIAQAFDAAFKALGWLL